MSQERGEEKSTGLKTRHYKVARCIALLRQGARLVAVLVALLAGPVARGQSAKPAEAIALEQQGKLEEAAAVWRAVTAQNPRDAGAFASLGVVLSKTRERLQVLAWSSRKNRSIRKRLLRTRKRLRSTESCLE